MLGLTTWEWVQTPYFWIPFLLCIGLIVLCFFIEKRKNEPKICQTCYSTRRNTRYTVRYWISDYLYNDSPCEDHWHD